MGTPALNEIHIHPAVLEVMGELAPGVHGYTTEIDGALVIPIIHAAEEGTGAVGRYLDSLPTDRTVMVPTVLNPRLAGMLQRRGFHPETIEADGELIDCWIRHLGTCVEEPG